MSEAQDAEAELRNPFPSPPSHYTNYTSHNLALLKLLNDRSDPASETQSQQEILADQMDVPQWSLKQLEKPRVDWILEDGHYNVFGETWYVSVDTFSYRPGS
jgi:mediator of RNA polymerase II transcription subunit 7